ncbi:MAG: hypothetical protein AAF865_08340 [Pseudomonadota bacterium]
MTRFANRIRCFMRDPNGTISVETAVMMPFLLGLFALSFVWYDAFRTKNAVLKATYSVADMISRETVELNDAYFSGLGGVFQYMTDSADETSLRITTIKCTDNCDDDTQRDLELCWSWASTGKTPLTNESLPDIEDTIPLMVLGDTVVITEGTLDYVPFFTHWMNEIIPMRNTVVTRPRFAPQVAYGELKCY